MVVCRKLCDSPLAIDGLLRRGVGDGSSALEVAARYSERRKAFGQKIRRFEGISLRELLGRRGVVRNIAEDTTAAGRLEEKVYE
jgi:alkylation response protein AidB-like acyl-CoA dehydrogenase